MASFVPTFEPPQPQEESEVLVDEQPESTTLTKGEDFFYIFIVDRSGSMSGRRMEVTKDAMKLFMQSLPPGCKFQIVSFGTTYESMVLPANPKTRVAASKQQAFLEYDQSTMEKAVSHISDMYANMGGTNILAPLSNAIDKLAVGHKETRIFLLTDGQVSDRDAVIKKANTRKDNIRVHTFGIGNGCDVDMVKSMAKVGRGSCSLVGDDVDNLNGLVVTALARASEPSLEGCKLVFGSDTEDLGEVFRNQLLTRSKIISRAEFEALQLKFTSLKDPSTGKPIEQQFSSAHFDMVNEGFGLFKLAARELIAKLPADKKVAASIKYQVLCDETAFVGVVKQKDKASG